MSEKMHREVSVETESVSDRPVMVNKGINWRSDVLDLIDRYAASQQRTRSWAANELMRTHPRLKRMARA